MLCYAKFVNLYNLKRYLVKTRLKLCFNDFDIPSAIRRVVRRKSITSLTFHASSTFTVYIYVCNCLQCRASLHFLKSAVCLAMTLAIACPHSPILFSLKRIALFKLLFMPLGKRLFVSFLSSDFDMEI